MQNSTTRTKKVTQLVGSEQEIVVGLLVRWKSLLRAMSKTNKEDKTPQHTRFTKTARTGGFFEHYVDVFQFWHSGVGSRIGDPIDRYEWGNSDVQEISDDKGN